MGAPVGNKNASRSREFRDALRWALENYHDREAALEKLLPSRRALFEIAMNQVDDAIQRNIKSVELIADRLDGKPVQGIDPGVDPAGNQIDNKLTVEFVRKNATDTDSGGV